METTTDYSRMDSQSNIYWLLSAFLGFSCFGAGSFIISDGLSYPYDLKLTISFAYLISIIGLGIYHMIELRVRNGICPSLYPSCIYTKENSLIPGFTIGIIGGIFLFLGQFFLLLGWFYDPLGKSITFLSLGGISPITSVLSFFVYKEKMSFLQIFGMIVSVSGIIYLGAGSLEGNWISYLCGIGALLSYSVRNLIGRAMENKGISVYIGVMLNSTGEILSGVVLLAWMAVYQGFDGLFTQESLFWQCLIGSILVADCLYFMNHAITTGNIGVVITIINCNGVLFILLDYFFYSNVPSLQSIIAIILIILGVVILLFGDKFKSCLVSKSGNERP